MITTEHGGLQVFNNFWDANNTSKIIDSIQPKKSGNPCSAIIKNITIGHLIGCESLTELCDKSLKEYFLSCNTMIHRTNYSRNMGKFNHYKQNTILVRLMEYIIPTLKIGKRAKKKALQILDASALEITGDDFEGAQWVYDGRIDGLVWGYEVLTQIINIGAYSLPIKFRVNDLDKEKIVQMFEDGRSKFGVDRVSFDAGFKGMGFYYELAVRCFKFYTKATMNWWWDFHGFLRQTTDLIKLAKLKFHRNYKYVDLIVEKEVDEGINQGEIMKLRLIFVKGDKRVFLTNDFESSPKEIYEFYCRRWKIEEMFKEEKINLGFEELTVRKTNAIRTHIITVFLAFIFCQLMLKRFPSIKGIKLFVRYVIGNIAELVETAKGVVVRFIHFFKYRLALEKLI